MTALLLLFLYSTVFSYICWLSFLAAAAAAREQHSHWCALVSNDSSGDRERDIPSSTTSYRHRLAVFCTVTMSNASFVVCNHRKRGRDWARDVRVCAHVTVLEVRPNRMSNMTSGNVMSLPITFRRSKSGFDMTWKAFFNSIRCRTERHWVSGGKLIETMIQ